MRQSAKKLKRMLRGIERLRQALELLGWSCWITPGDPPDGYIIGSKDFVNYASELLIVDLDETDIAKEDKDAQPK